MLRQFVEVLVITVPWVYCILSFIEFALLTLRDFNKIKDVLLELTETVKEIELTYDTLYNELEKRVKIR